MRYMNRLAKLDLASYSTLLLAGVSTISVTACIALSSPAGAEEIADSLVLDPITVTADRRLEDALDVPTSMHITSGEVVEQRFIEDTEALIRSVPNANLTKLRSSLGELNFSIRGVGTTTINVDQAIGYYIDNVPVASISEFGAEFYDIERIEIQRGPQGTLYGRSALGGVVNILTKEPGDELEARLSGVYASDNERRVHAMVNLPIISDTLLGRFNFLGAAHDGRIHNIATGKSDIDEFDSLAGRGKLLFRPNETMQFTLSGDISDSEYTNGFGNFDTVLDDGVDQTRPQVTDKLNYGVSLESNFDFDTFSIVSLSGFRAMDLKGSGSRAERSVFGFYAIDNDSNGTLDQKTFSQELRVQSDDEGRLKWTTGLFFQYNDADRTSDIVNVSNGAFVTPGLFERSYSTTKDTSFAVFGDATYDLTEKLSVTSGVRATWDQKELNYRHEGSFAPLFFGSSFAPQQTLDQKANFSDVSPRFALEYKITPDINIYGKIGRGYKAGGFNTEFVGATNTAYDKENIWSYEAGLKTRLFDGRFEFEANVFHMDWRDQQILLFNSGISSTANAKKSRSQGVELEARAYPVDGLVVRGSAGYVDATFTDAPGALSSGGNAKGNFQPNTSKWSASLGARYETSVFGNLTAFIDGEWQYKSSFYFDVDNNIKEPEHNFVNLSGGVKGENFELSLFAKNVFDEKHRVEAQPEVPGFFAAQAQPGTGRVIGVKGTLTY